MPGIGDIRAGAAYVEIGTRDSDLVAGLNRAAARLRQFGSAVRGIGLEIAGAGGAIFAPLVAAGKAFADQGEKLALASAKTGIAVESLSTLGYAAQQSGIDMDTLGNAMSKMGKSFESAVGGSKEATAALADLGISVADLAGQSPDERFKTIAEGLSKITDPSERAAEAMKIFGKSGADLLPLLDQGSAGINKLQERARSLGLQWSGEDANNAKVFAETIRDLWDVANRLAAAIGSAVSPVLSEAAKLLTLGTIAAQGWVKEHGTMIATAAAVSGGLVLLGGSIVVLGTTISSFGVIVGTVSSALGLLTVALDFVVSPFALIGGGALAAGAALLYFTDTGRSALGSLGDGFSDLKSDAMAAFEGIKNAFAADNWRAAAQILWAAVRVEWDKGVTGIKAATADLLRPFAGAIALMETAWRTWTSFAVSAWGTTIRYIGEAWERLGLGDRMASVWKGFKTALAAGVDYAVYGFSAIEGIVRNWQDSLTLVWKTMALGAVTAFGEIKYLITDIIPTSLGWLASNGPKLLAGLWIGIFEGAANLFRQLWAYVSDVAPKIGKMLWDAIKSGGASVLKFDEDQFASFKAGFGQDAAATGGPKFNDRVESDTEKSLKSDVAKLQAGLGDEIQKAYARNKAALDGLTAAFEKASKAASDPKNGVLPNVDAAKKELADAQAALDALLKQARDAAAPKTTPDFIKKYNQTRAGGGQSDDDESGDDDQSDGKQPTDRAKSKQDFIDKNSDSIGAFNVFSQDMANEIYGPDKIYNQNSPGMDLFSDKSKPPTDKAAADTAANTKKMVDLLNKMANRNPFNGLAVT